MPERYVDAILKYLADREYQPLKPRQLARQMGVSDEDYGTFRTAIKQLRDAGRVVEGARDSLTLPAMATHMVGFFRANPRGFGFIEPEEPTAHGDLVIPPDQTNGAMNGDLVQGEVMRRTKRDGEIMVSGRVARILKRGSNRFVGALEEAKGTWFVMPDGKGMTRPIVVRDVGAAPKAGTKVVVEIVQYPEAGQLPQGVIVETLGRGGQLDVETTAVIRAFGLAEEYPAAALDEARATIAKFQPHPADGREDIRSETIITIDPPDARDFDDAISLKRGGDGSMTLGVHIADVSHFVVEGGSLDESARQRSTSVYFPRRVLPMLPEILSNGVCSLQEGQPRFVKSAYIRYDEDARVVETRFAESLMQSTKRLTYLEAQGILDGEVGGYDPEVVRLMTDLAALARRIERRRRAAGMIHLDLPEVDLVFDDAGNVTDAVPADDSYTHTMIEMFMVEANEAVAALMDRLSRPCLRRVHPAPDPRGDKQLKSFLRACGHRLPHDISRKELQDLLDKVRGRPESYAVNLAVLKSFQQAEYSPMKIGHYALASEDYCHFTSPIRRYPDLTVHRMLREHCRGALKTRPPEDVPALTKLGQDCTASEQRAESAERELRQVLILQMLTSHVGETFRGVITGVTNFGIFVQSPRYLVEGLVRLQDLGDDWWEVTATTGSIRGERTGKTYRIGDMMTVRIAAVDVPKRQLNLVPSHEPVEGQGKKSAPKPKSKPKSKSPRPRKMGHK